MSRAAAGASWSDRQVRVLLFAVFTLLYAYFFQGGGWNQNSHFDAIRSLVERRTFEITAFAGNTGDVGVFQGRTYSNKPPGLALWGAPFYLLIVAVERGLGVAIDAPLVVTANAHLLTIACSAMPAVVLLLILYQHFRRRGATVREALVLTGGFGAGSLLLPYSGVLMNHALTACLLFAAWHLVSGPRLDRIALIGGGLLAGGAVLTEYLTLPAVALATVYLAWRRRWDAPLLFLIGPAIAVAVLLVRNQVLFDSPLVNNYSVQSQQFTARGLLFGMLGRPEPIRLVWLTVHPFRGLFYCCPLFLIVVLSLVRPWRPATARAETIVHAGVVLSFLLFYLSFNGWAGGWSVGPRYLIPALPFLYTGALPGYRRFPRLSAALIVVSTAVMLAVTAVQTMIPAPDGGPAPDFNPVTYVFRQLANGRVSISIQSMLEVGPAHSPSDAWDSYNLGEVFGLPELFSLLPPLALLLVFATVVVGLQDTEPAPPR